MSHKNIAIYIVLFASLAGCGGGGSDNSSSASLASLTAAVATIQLPVPQAKLAWNLTTAMSVTLKDTSGAVVPAASVTCAAFDPVALSVASDCSSVKGIRLGLQKITVSGKGFSATASVKTIPQRQALANHGVDDQGDYNLLVTPAGNVLAWGSNQSGVLGQGVNSGILAAASLPLLVKDASGTGVLSNIVAASAGESNAMALTEDGAVLAWGGGQNFSRSDGTNNLPQNVVRAGNLGILKNIVQVSVGDGNAAALADDGTVYSWGDYAGQGRRAVLPDQVKNPAGDGILTHIVAISAGWNHTLALSDDGKVYEWGYQSGGQASNNTQALPKLVKRTLDNTELTNIVAISDGHLFSLALTSDEKIYAWGQNDQGQMGQDFKSYQYMGAVLVTGVTCRCTLNNISMISAGGNHALALDTSGNVYSWGFGGSGQLGVGAANNNALLPVQVVATNSAGPLDGIVSIAAGYSHSLAVTKDGSVLIWGAGLAGNLGQGGRDSAINPVPSGVKNSAGSGMLSLTPLASYPNLLGRGR